MVRKGRKRRQEDPVGWLVSVAGSGKTCSLEGTKKCVIKVVY